MNAPPLVLLVEDDEDIRLVVKDVLEGSGYLVELAEGGVQALARLAEGAAPVLILIDLMMPVMDGVTLAKKIAALPGEPKPRIVFLTAAAPGPLVADLPHPVMRKPFDLEAFLEMVGRETGRAGK
ncbi:MAG TPA: response regulator [Polyangiaceae bacterium]|jgi:CheY-like chemotaxis protein